MADPDLRGAALAYAAKGVPVFPCNPATKKPLTKHGFKEASIDPDIVTGLWQRWPDAMIGMPTGTASGVWVLDVDDPGLFEANAPSLPSTRKAMTGKGYHLHFRYDEATPVRNAQRNAKTKWPFLDMPGTEVRGEGGYVILPPSRHPSGRLYQWEDECEPVTAPAELMQIVCARDNPIPDRSEAHTGAGRHEGSTDTPYGLKALEGECSAIRAACDGEQECTLNVAGLKVGGLVAGGELSGETARRELLAAGLAMQSFKPRDPWTKEKITKKVDRALADGKAQPRSAPESRSANVSAQASQSIASAAIHATPYGWPDPRTLPTREWLFGRWLLRGEVTAIIAPGGTGKSTIATTVALSLASGRPLFGMPLPRGKQAVWIFNLEDGTEELERQVSAACLFHGIGREECGDRLYLDSGLVQPLCTAAENRDGYTLAENVFAQVDANVWMRGISVVIVDPFVSSHAVQENSNEAIDAIIKRWKRLAQENGCAVVLVHHTKKLGGREVTAEDGRGAVALRDAARVVLPLNPMGEKDAQELGITDAALRRSLVRIDTGKANRAPPDAATWIKLESQSLGNGSDTEPSDFVGVATLWEKPDVFHGLTTWHLHQVQQRLAAGDWRESVQAKDWVGHLIAEVAVLSAATDIGRIKAIQREWIEKGALEIERRRENGRRVPYVIVGKPVNLSEIGTRPHLQTCGAEGAESAGDDPR